MQNEKKAPKKTKPCQHEWRRTGHCGMVIFRECIHCGEEDEKDVS